MTQLSTTTLPEHAQCFSYDRDAITAGIVHFGIGNFHRAHQAVYCDDLLEAGARDCGITGISLRSASVRDALEPQDYLYTLATLGAETDYRIIGAIKDILVAPHDPQAVIDVLANPATRLVSSTITEKGYHLASSKVDFDQADLKAEMDSLDSPKTIYGFLAAGIILRHSRHPAEKLTIICCDNISGGGEFLKQGVHHLLAQHSSAALAWSQDHVAFVSSMVDRVCPATDDALRTSVLRDTGRKDAWPVSAEPFRQWIIEGDFADDRPAFDTVGAVFVDNIAPFESMKLSYLNAAHTIASTLGHLSGDRFVHQSLERPEVFTFMLQTLHANVLPNAPVPSGYNGAAYIEDVIQRFQNSSLPYANLQVGTDSSQKIQQRWFPTIEHAVDNQSDTTYFEFCLGAWVIFIETALRDDVLNDPKEESLRKAATEDIDQLALSYLKIANADKYEFFGQPKFMAAVIEHAKAIKSRGIERALQDFLANK